MAAAITRARADAQVAKVRTAAMATVKRAKQEADKRKHTLAVGVLSAGIGFYEAQGKTLPSIVPGVPPKIQVAVIAALIADNTTGDTQRYANALCDGMTAIAGYNFGKGQAIGADDDGDTVDV